MKWNQILRLQTVFFQQKSKNNDFGADFSEKSDFKISFSYHRTKNLIYDRRRKNAIDEFEFYKLLSKNLKADESIQRERIQNKLKTYKDGRIQTLKHRILYHVFKTFLIPTIVLFIIYSVLM